MKKRLALLALIAAALIALTACEPVKDLVIREGTKEIQAHQYEDNTTLETVVIPDSVTSIGEYAFKGCASLTSVVIPDSVTKIGAYAFNGCANLKSIVIPDSVTEVGCWAFYGCKSLSEVTLPAGAEYDTPFLDNPSLTHITITGEAFPPVGEYGYSDGFMQTLGHKGAGVDPTVFETVERVTVAPPIADLGDYALAGCYGLKTVELPDTLVRVGEAAFADCRSLETVVLPDSLVEIGEDAFGWNGLTSIDIPASVTAIGDGAFRNCANLTRISIPPSVESLGEDLFKDCDALRRAVWELFPVDFESAVDVSDEAGRLIPEGARVVPMGEYGKEILNISAYNVMPADVRSADWSTADYAIILNHELHRDESTTVVTVNAYGASANARTYVTYNIYLCGRDGTIRLIGSSSSDDSEWVWKAVEDRF